MLQSKKAAYFKGFNSTTHFSVKESIYKLLEKDIVAAIMRLFKRVPRCFAWKEHGGMVRPDRVLCNVD